MSAFPSTMLAGERYAVCGLGRNGSAVVKALLDMGAIVQAWDDRDATLPPHDRLTLAPLDDLSGMEALILSPGIPHKLPKPHPAAERAISQGIPILSDAEILWRVVRKTGSKARFVSVTGTNGKSTTTALIAHILQYAKKPVAAGGNLGTASLALPAFGDDGIYVIEMSSYMLERLDRYHANAACLLNITPDHLDRHGDMKGYAAAKSRAFDNMGPADLAVIGTGEAECLSIASTLQTRTVPVRLLRPAEVPSYDRRALPGDHNAQNVAAAWAIAKHLGLKDDVIRDAVQTFPGLAHRLQKVAEWQGVSFINDSKATNAEAASKALASYPRVMWIAGGIAKAGGIDALTPWFGHIEKAYLIGRDAEILAQTLLRHQVTFERCDTLDVAVPAAFHDARKHAISTVLLSPACASFDQFESFEARGSYFLHICDHMMQSEHSETTHTQED